MLNAGQSARRGRRLFPRGRRAREAAEARDPGAPEGIELREVGPPARLSVIEGRRPVDDPAVLQVVEEDDVAEGPALSLRDGREAHVELPGGRPLYKEAVVGHHAPDEPGAIEALEAGSAPDVGTPEMRFDRPFHARPEVRSLRGPRGGSGRERQPGKHANQRAPHLTAL